MVIVDIIYKVSCCVLESVVIVDRRESQSIMCSGKHGGSGQKSDGLVLCPGVRGDSGQGRVTKCHVVS